MEFSGTEFSGTTHTGGGNDALGKMDAIGKTDAIGSTPTRAASSDDFNQCLSGGGWRDKENGIYGNYCDIAG